MIKTILIKTGYALLWLWVISILAFWLSRRVPGDEILDYLSIESYGRQSTVHPDADRLNYLRVAQKRGLNLPQFYFSIRKGIYTDTLFHILPREDRQAIKTWIETSHQGDEAISLYRALRNSLSYSCNTPEKSRSTELCCSAVHGILQTPDLTIVAQELTRLSGEIHSMSTRDSTLDYFISTSVSSVQKLQERTPLSLAQLLPSFQWNGSRNQYHRWMRGWFSLEPLASLIDGRNAWTKIYEALRWTLILNGLAFLVAISLGVVIGIWSGVRDGRVTEKWTSVLLFALFAMPSFWLATLLILFFSSGEWLAIFPSGGLGPYHAATSFFQEVGILTRHLFLPVMCLALGSLAYVSRQMKQSVRHELDQRYVHSLRALGISEKTILRKHVVRNALFPMITMIGSALPALLSGSLIIEVIFSIPGMGRLMYTSLLARDWPVVFPVLMLAATVTVLAYLLTDIVYKWVDPRVKTWE